jgi:hypothetical protein
MVASGALTCTFSRFVPEKQSEQYTGRSFRGMKGTSQSLWQEAHTAGYICLGP